MAGACQPVSSSSQTSPARVVNVPGALFSVVLPPVHRRRRVPPSARALARVLAVTQTLWFDSAGLARPLNPA
ncbi:MAG: hypothetical protein Q4F13_08190 [Pseudomonadota bacterium]|nr:hypothetical protein [Pseudomonadota bacterium]